MASFTEMLLLSMSMCAVVLTDANAFLRAQPQGDVERVAAREVEQTLLLELSALGQGSTSFLELQEALRPMYAALPKNSNGKLEASTVRYALHRLFVQKRGWYVQGLEPLGGAWNASSPASVMKDRVPSYIQGLFEQRVHGHGLDLQELTAFAATLQDLVHEEELARLTHAYAAVGLPLLGRVSSEMIDKAIKVFLMTHLSGSNISGASVIRPEALEKAIGQSYPAWPETAMWALDLRRTVDYDQRSVRNPFVDGGLDFAQAAIVVKEIGHRFGAFQNQECRGLKDVLVAMEDRGTGRVRLSDFYHGGLGSEWQFSESVDYLRSLGALDESDERRPSVVIPNYISSPSNCLASSSFYSVCCLNECEGLLGQLERALSAPSAGPAQIVELVARLPSDTVDAPRNLSTELLLRLDEIAHLHGGSVPLHGRLFAQWMHHAYPRECPFPHAAGSTSPMTPNEWMAASGTGSAVASEDEMRSHVVAGNETYVAVEDKRQALPWTTVEELVIAPSAHAKPSPWSLLQRAILLASFASMAAPLAVRGAKELAAPEPKLPRYDV